MILMWVNLAVVFILIVNIILLFNYRKYENKKVDLRLLIAALGLLLIIAVSDFLVNFNLSVSGYLDIINRAAFIPLTAIVFIISILLIRD